MSGLDTEHASQTLAYSYRRNYGKVVKEKRKGSSGLSQTSWQLLSYLKSKLRVLSSLARENGLSTAVRFNNVEAEASSLCENQELEFPRASGDRIQARLLYDGHFDPVAIDGTYGQSPQSSLL